MVYVHIEDQLNFKSFHTHLQQFIYSCLYYIGNKNKLLFSTILNAIRVYIKNFKNSKSKSSNILSNKQLLSDKSNYKEFDLLGFPNRFHVHCPVYWVIFVSGPVTYFNSLYKDLQQFIYGSFYYN